FPAQKVGDEYIAYVKGLEPMAAAPMWFVYGEAEKSSMKVDANGFDTPFYKGTFDGDMRISAMYDKKNARELCKKGETLNRIVYYENRPHNYDAWDINIYYDERSWEVEKPASVETVSEGPVATILRAKWLISDSEIVQDIAFYKDIARVDFKTVVDWKEPHGLLKAHFPVDVFYNEAQFDIQYGNVRRATHKNTSWDVARFEVCAHKWADVSEAGYGVALMNDCKYGYSVDENNIALTLVKSATNPDPTADQEMHEFSYSILPHDGDWRNGSIPVYAYEFNIPVLAVKAEGGDNMEIAPTFASVDQENVMIECVKGALHGEGSILRMYECYGKRTNVVLSVPEKFEKAVFTSLMEDDEKEAKFENGKLNIELKPYEIVTIRII
ncbi:MAG: alpha-mannosidase, partial [Clostridia bacterium]|nr:alpha-mannosidase [Clostridia bacterium]